VTVSPAATDLAERLIRRCAADGLGVSTAESLTGGLVCAALTDVAGSSAVVRGGIVSYTVAAKADVLGVDSELLDRVGAVHEDTAVAMARATVARFGSDFGLSTTGVAGPGPSHGNPAGLVFIAVAASPDLDGPVVVRRLQLAGDRTAVRIGTVEAVLGLLAALLEA
jgi:nicotinamide-nucleotide amidase